MRILFALVLILTLSACGKRRDNSQLSFINKLDAIRQMEKSTVECSNGSCPSFVGGLFFVDVDPKNEKGWGVGGCSLTLIGPDLVLTNGHCVPREIRSAGAGCGQSIKFSFPDSRGNAAEKIDCSHVVSISHDPNDTEKTKIDYAILRMSRSTTRTPVESSYNGVQNNQSVILYKVNFFMNEDDVNQGEIVRTQCTANSNHADATQHTGVYGPIINIDSCDDRLRLGNSGVGVLDSNNSLIGVFSWVYKNSSIGVGGGTNLICVPINGRSTPSECVPVF